MRPLVYLANVSLISVLLISVLLISVLLTAVSVAQQQSPPPSDSGASATSSSASSSPSAALRSLPRKAAKRHPIDDYVPCLFDEGEIRDSRALDDLSNADQRAAAVAEADKPLSLSAAVTVANALQTGFTVIASSPPPPGSIKSKGGPTPKPDKATVNFAQSVTPDLFVNKTPEQIPDIVKNKAIQIGNLPLILTPGNALSTQAASLVTSTQTNIESIPKYDRPDDVSCSFSIMQWKETSDTFGRRVANQYVALEVNVRNLNQQNEFLIHDIQIAVDTGLDRAQFGRFQAARDKLIVRSVAQRGQSEDRRNLVISALQGMGAIAGGASTAVTQGLSNSDAATDLSSAVAIFQGPFITGIINMFPDHTLEHINHINDLAFSASSTSKTVVPIQGSVPLITFLAEKPLEQLPFARCGTEVPKRLWYLAGLYTSSRDSTSNDSPGASTYPFCEPDPYGQDGNALPRNERIQADFYMRRFPFRKWQGAALDVLEHRVFVVIAGVHIKEVQKQPTLSSITCLPNNDTTIDLSKITGSNANCMIKGEDLDLISQVSLQDATDSNDKLQVNGTSSVSGDITQADVAFLKSDLLQLKGTVYKLMYSLKGGSPQSTSLSLTIKPPLAITITPSSIDFGDQKQGAPSNSKTITVTNNGPALTVVSVKVAGDNASDFSLSPAGGCGTSIDSGKACSLSVTFTPGAVGARTATLSIAYSGSGSPQTVTLTGNGIAPSPAPAASPTPLGH